MSDNDIKYENLAVDVNFTSDSIWVELSNGHFVRVYLTEIPSLLNASPEERANWCYTDGGQGIHWPDINVEISVNKLLGLSG